VVAPLALLGVERAREGALGALVAQHLVLGRREARLPLRVGERQRLDARRAGGGLGSDVARAEAERGQQREQMAAGHGQRSWSGCTA
jgi:hypothetical protein